MATFIVGAILAVILYFAFRRTIKDLKSGTCAGCSGSCKDKNCSQKIETTDFTDLNKH